MEEREQPLERRERRRLRVGVLVVEPLLHRFRVPVAEVVEGQVVELVDQVGEVEVGEQALDLALGLRQPRENPALLDRRRPLLRLDAFGSLENQPCDVPELVRELSPLVDGAFGERHVLGRGHLHQPVARGVGAVAVEERQRVHARAEALRHPAAARCVDEGVNDDVRERDVAHDLEPGEDHPVLPEADDVSRGRVQVAGVERPQVVRVIGPAERRERPKARREPRVEDVGASHELGRAALGARRRLLLLDGRMAVGTLPQRELMTPPDLAGDVPVGRLLE